jgi:GDP-4-dehydro-6-deoxy-D-mannose reductase
MKRVLVSGAGGFLGRHLLARLVDGGAWVATVGRDRVGSPLHFQLGDAPWSSDQWSMALETARPDVIFHLAGLIQGREDDLQRVNVGLAETLFEALGSLGARPALIFAGSAAEYGGAIVDGAPVTEDAVCRPNSDYGCSKLAQTEKALEFAQASGARVLVARIFNLIGAGMTPRLAPGDFARQLAQGDTLLVGNLDVRRDYIDVADAAASLVSLAATSEAKGLVNVASGAAVSLASLAERLIHYSGRKVRIVIDPARVRPFETRVVIGSTARLASLGVRPPPFDIDAAARKLLLGAGGGSGDDRSPARHSA